MFFVGKTILKLKEKNMQTGSVKWFNETKGYGFIELDSNENDVFVHISAVQAAGLTSLKEGQAISFEITENKGKQSATNLEVK